MGLLPYKLVMNKLRHAAPGLSEELKPEMLDKLLTSLFPLGEVHCPSEIWARLTPMDVKDVSSQEI